MKDKIINVRLTPELYSRIKNKYDKNFSEVLRKHFSKILEDEDKRFKSFKTCYFCKNKNNFSLDELYIVNLKFPKEEKYVIVFIIICSKCRDEILTGNKILDDDESILFCDLENTSIKGCVFDIAKLHLNFPDIFKHNDAVVFGTLNSIEELKEFYIKINEQEGL